MQFKIDENLPIEIAELLIDAGYDAKALLLALNSALSHQHIFNDQVLLIAL